MVIEVKIDYDTRLRAIKEAQEIGILEGSLTNGRGNKTGALGEIVAHQIIGGERVGAIHFSHDIALPNGLTVDVKTTKAATRPLPYFVARVYASERDREKLATKCDAYYFMRCHQNLHTVWALGWMFADEFVEKAIFHPQGSVNREDGRMCRSDEYTVPISALRDARAPISR